MKRNLDLFHPCGWHLHPSGWRDGVTSYAEWADKVAAMWPWTTFEHPDMDTVLCARTIAELEGGHIRPLSEREMFDDLESLAQLKATLGCKLMIYEGAAQRDFNFQQEWGVWSRVVQLAQPDYIVFDAITTAEQAKFYGDLGKNLNVPVLFEPYHKPELSKPVAGSFQLDGYGRNGDWNWDVCLSRMAREVAGYDRDSLARLWYLWISMPWNQRDNTEVNAMTQKAITEALAVGIRNVGLNLNHVKPGAFLEPTLRWLEELQLPI